MPNFIPRRRWSATDRIQLVRLASQAVPTDLIARRLNRTTIAIRVQAHRGRVRLVALPRGRHGAIRRTA